MSTTAPRLPSSGSLGAGAPTARRGRRPGPYAHAPRLPEGEEVDLRALVTGEWLELEVGPGPKAGFLVERAMVEPRAGLVAIEVRRKWATVGDERLAKAGAAARARVFCDDARIALPRLMPAGSVRRVFLHFPDPWWKKRHHKRLVMGDAFLEQVARLLEPGGELFIQTDVEERAELYAGVVGASPTFVPAGDVPGSPVLADNPFGARSPREHRAIADGLPVHRMLWRRGTA
jgi:tRNA (guanine-N7-)-methyltransferase